MQQLPKWKQFVKTPYIFVVPECPYRGPSDVENRWIPDERVREWRKSGRLLRRMPAKSNMQEMH